MRSYFCFNRILAGVIALLLMATIFFACTKTSSDATPSNTNDNLSIGAAADQASVSGIYDDLFSIAAEISESEGLSETGRKSGKLDRPANWVSVILLKPMTLRLIIGLKQ